MDTDHTTADRSMVDTQVTVVDTVEVTMAAMATDITDNSAK
ncbi:hypothetical protein TELCIR_20599 [Teladorsagia circumcincta]|uniref:Uncharacterized protein n=1 Tax=Teladorsagia circumcincta TaxID=45464 RepID=A0A2G9TJ27_TELCI|nr:hypothetical protein TELCIR_20599 [Teladorsagia circumcincta]